MLRNKYETMLEGQCLAARMLRYKDERADDIYAERVGWSANAVGGLSHEAWVGFCETYEIATYGRRFA